MPDSSKKIQQFIGFPNFYRWFIRGFSTTPAILNALTFPQVGFNWSQEADKAFQKLKHHFNSEPNLILLDPQCQFVVEMYASIEGIVAVLSLRSETDGKMHHRTFVSCQLSSAEKNYHAGIRELLVVKVALEEWRNWLESVKHPFIVWTDHKNHEYI